ncbi:protein TFG-like isoform X2 [Dreissena polymorpha]|uniref:protein TFG-like isoform X2 n=1 Tax=Dreissena polymorpha TaxID=45954 RepID=UPI0022649C5C|nr:protein TFG-like isoform X2 [Dreissena polymorpha]
MNEPGIDLTGKLIIKTALGDDIRRILITNEDITYDELLLMMQRVYRGKLNSTDDIVIKYKDEDNDLITIFDSSDLSFAIQCSRILKITLFVNGKPEPLQSDELKHIKGELRAIRDSCVQLLDKLDARPDHDQPSSTVDIVKPKPVKMAESPRRTPQPSTAPGSGSAGPGGKEFDPLSSQRRHEDQNKIMSSFSVAADQSERAGSPDSISSVGSAARQQPPQTGTPTHQGGYQQGAASSQKVPPWQQQQQHVSPSPYSQPQPQGTGFEPVVMNGQKFYTPASVGQDSFAGRDSPQQSKSSQHYDHALMQSNLYTGHSQADMAKGYTPSGLAQQAQGSSYSSVAQSTSAQPQSSPQHQYSQGGALPPQGQPQGYGAAQPGGGAQYGAYNQPGASQAGTAQAGQPAYGPTAQVSYGAQQMTGQPSSQGIPQQVGAQAYQQAYQQTGSPAPTPAGPGQPGQGNPYARQGPGYSAGYPRPSGNYPQGYQ